METMSEIVLRQLVCLASNCELAAADAVGVTSYRRAEVARTVHRVGILFQIVIAKHHVGGFAVGVRHDKRNYATAEIGDAHFHAVAVLKREECSLLIVYNRIETCGVES